MKITLYIKSLFLVCFFMGFLSGQVESDKKIFEKSLSSYSKNPENGLIRCISTEYEGYLQAKDKNRASEKEFEEWLAPKAQKMKKNLESGKMMNDTLIIPVVVHVIHNGVAEGNGANISDARVQSQIDVLNEDYMRMFGTRGYNTNSVGADIGIKFVLAKVDPIGNYTNGINRVFMSGYVWGEINVENILKPQTQWDPVKYFNIWVCEFGGDLNGVLGYAQFPEASGLEGLSNDTNTKTDGVIVDWRSFGSSDTVPGTYFTSYDKGRTLTHEIGHAFGLVHIWGNTHPDIPKTCNVDAKDSYHDYCLDTPAAAKANYSCKTVIDSCPTFPGVDMVENYMDYTNDICMNIFTQDQKARILTVLHNSPRRATLTTSDVWKGDIVKGSGDILTYPNPVKKEFNIVFKNKEQYPTEYKIFDANGSLKEKRSLPNSKSGFKIDTSSFTQGVYTLVVSTNKGNKKFRFMVVK